MDMEIYGIEWDVKEIAFQQAMFEYQRVSWFVSSKQAGKGETDVFFSQVQSVQSTC